MPAESDRPITTPHADDAPPSMEPVLRRIANKEEAIANHHKDGLLQEASMAPSSSVDDVSAVAGQIDGMESCLEAFRKYSSELRRLMRRARAADTGERRAASPAGDPAASRAPAPRQDGATSNTGILVRKDHVFDTETEAVVSNAEHPPAQPPPTQRPPAQQFPAQDPFPEGPPTQYFPAQGPFPKDPPAQYFPSQHSFTQRPPFQRPPAQHFPAQGPLPRGPPAQYFPAQHPFTRGSPVQRPPAQYFPAQGPFPEDPAATFQERFTISTGNAQSGVFPFSFSIVRTKE